MKDVLDLQKILYETSPSHREGQWPHRTISCRSYCKYLERYIKTSTVCPVDNQNTSAITLMAHIYVRYLTDMSGRRGVDTDTIGDHLKNMGYPSSL